MLSLNSATEHQNVIIAAFGPKLETILTFRPCDAGSVDSADKVGYDFGLDVALASQGLESPGGYPDVAATGQPSSLPGGL
jgi:hypothetical protein